MMRRVTQALLPALLLAASPAPAEPRPAEEDLFAAEEQPGPDRPSESDLFGAPASETSSARDEEALFGAPEAEVRKAAGSGDLVPQETAPREAALFDGSERAPRLTEEAAPEDPLSIGGQIYMRAALIALEERPPSKWFVSAPTLVDAYFDARPNDRVRGFVLGRLHYDPTVVSTGGSTAMAAAAGYGSARQLSGALDQLWLRFDIGRSVFLTAGRQHVKWGTGRFWNPTDFLHQARRDPLAQFDARLGTTLLKLHVPWEKRGWNFYGIALLEGAKDPNAFGGIGLGGRAEVVLGLTELGLSAVAQQGHKPKLGIDLSSGLGPFDVYGEVAVRRDTDAPLYRLDPADTRSPTWPLARRQPKGTVIGATAGINWDVQINDEDVLTLSGEYFYNSEGYERSANYSQLLPRLMATGDGYVPFYLGKHYLGLYAVLIAPGRWENTVFALSTLGNLSDRSFVTRLDYSVLVLTHLRLEAYGAVHYGKKGGELTPAVDIPAMNGSPALHLEPRVQVGVGLRVNI